MLAVVDGVAFADLAAREQVEEAEVLHGPLLGAEHRANPDPAGAQRPPRHHHAPVDAARLVAAVAAGPVAVGGLGDELAEHVAVGHHGPAAPLLHHSRHRGDVRGPGRAGRVRAGTARSVVGGRFVMRVRSGCRNGLPGNWNRGCGKNGKNQNGFTNHECSRWALIYISSPPIFLRTKENDADHL